MHRRAGPRAPRVGTSLSGERRMGPPDGSRCPCYPSFVRANRSLATSFVTTVCFSCASSGEPADVPQASANPSSSAAPLVSVTPPPPKNQTAARAIAGELGKLPNGVCRWVETIQSNCPPGAPCNPPEPRIVNPAPCGRGHGTAQLRIDDAGQCSIVERFDAACAPNAKCNPPDPIVHAIACPSWMR